MKNELFGLGYERLIGVDTGKRKSALNCAGRRLRICLPQIVDAGDTAARPATTAYIFSSRFTSSGMFILMAEKVTGPGLLPISQKLSHAQAKRLFSNQPESLTSSWWLRNLKDAWRSSQ